MATAILAGSAIPFPESPKKLKKLSVYHAVVASLAAAGLVAKIETDSLNRQWVRTVIGRYEFQFHRDWDRWSGLAYHRGADDCNQVEVSTAIHPKSSAAFVAKEVISLMEMCDWQGDFRSLFHQFHIYSLCAFKRLGHPKLKPRPLTKTEKAWINALRKAEGVGQ